MRTLRIVALVLISSFCVWAQDTPQTSPSPDSQAPAQGNWQQRRGPGTGGTITAINGNSMTIKTRDGQTAQVNLSDATRYRKGRDEAKLADLKVGDMVFVRGEQKDGIWQAEVVAERPAGGMGMGGQGGNFRENMGKTFIIGEVTAINGTQLTIKRPDDVTQNITVDENTSFHKDNESVTLTDLKVGDHVFGRGELKDNVFVPSQLNVGQPHFGGMRGQGGPHGQSGTSPQQPQQQ
jgi:Cu/Ag efflux protein CusF